MIEALPIWINLLFVMVTAIALFVLYLSNNRNKQLTLAFMVIGTMQGFLGYIGFYQSSGEVSPRFLLILLPTILLFIYLFRENQRTELVKHRNLRISTFLHSIRIPIEIGLLYLFYNNMIPELMTFEGRNYDILAGITAPIIGLLYLKNGVSNKHLLFWNILGLALVLFIMINGILSAESPLQQFAFDQPNKALIYFPIIFLPAVLVPIVIFTHLIDIIKLRNLIKAK